MAARAAAVAASGPIDLSDDDAQAMPLASAHPDRPPQLPQPDLHGALLAEARASEPCELPPRKARAKAKAKSKAKAKAKGKSKAKATSKAKGKQPGKASAPPASARATEQGTAASEQPPAAEPGPAFSALRIVRANNPERTYLQARLGQDPTDRTWRLVVEVTARATAQHHQVITRIKGHLEANPSWGKAKALELRATELGA